MRHKMENPDGSDPSFTRARQNASKLFMSRRNRKEGSEMSDEQFKQLMARLGGIRNDLFAIAMIMVGILFTIVFFS